MKALSITFGLLAAALSGWAFAQGGWQPALAALGGVVGTTAYLYCSWLMVRGIGAGHGGDGNRAPHPLIVFLAVMFKLPLIYGGWLLAQQLGPLGPGFFLAGLALVYCALVSWGVVSNRTQ